MSQIHDGIAGGSFVEDGTTGSYIMDMVSADVPIFQTPVVAESVQSQIADLLGQWQIGAVWPGSIMWGSVVVYWMSGPTWIKADGSKPFRWQLMNNSLIGSNRASDPTSKTVQIGFFFGEPLILEVDGERQWNGIGGFIYIPSFPQLERKETSWPHAT